VGFFLHIPATEHLAVSTQHSAVCRLLDACSTFLQ